MLQHIKAHYITLSSTPPAYHLGDIINIIQQYHLRSLDNNDVYNVWSDAVCPCGCHSDTSQTIKDVLKLLDTRLRFNEEKPESSIQATPFWFKKHELTEYDSLSYAKAKNLPKSRKNYVACQFDASSTKNRKEVDSMTITRVLQKFNNLVNVGSKKLEIRSGGDSLKEKFDLIANAQFYIGIDSGLTHLALMTDTPVFVMHPLDWPAMKYYPKCDQIRYCTSHTELFGKVKTWLGSIS